MFLDCWPAVMIVLRDSDAPLHEIVLMAHRSFSISHGVERRLRTCAYRSKTDTGNVEVLLGLQLLEWHALTAGVSVVIEELNGDRISWDVTYGTGR